jgi:hypothetical protein
MVFRLAHRHRRQAGQRDAVLLCQENEEFSRRARDPQERAYVLKASADGQEAPFGFLYVSATGYTLGWPGALDFSMLEREVVQELPQSMEAGEVIASNLLAKSTVSLILGAGDALQMVKCRLQDSEERSKYRSLLATPSAIDFVRYDVGDDSSPLQYTFTAENARADTEPGEICVARPKKEPVTPSLLDWIVEHHAQGTGLAGNLNRDAAASTLTSVIGPAQHVAASHAVAF